MRKVLEPSQEKRFNSAQVALEALLKPEKNHFSFINYTAIKPVDSKIILSKNSGAIEIIKPGTGLMFSSLGKLGTNILCNFFTIIIVLIFSQIPLFGTVISLTLIWLAIVKWVDFLFEVFGETRLIINTKIIYLNYELFGIKYQKNKSSSRQDIIKLEYINSFAKEQQNFQGKIYYQEIPPAIIIWAGNKQYKLTGITQTELDWLLKELSDYLELPFQRRIVPVVKSS